jgi:hypothetical protein
MPLDRPTEVPPTQVIRRSRLLEFVLFQTVWLICALGAARGMSWPGLIAVAAFAAFCLPCRDRRWAVVVVMLVSAVCGVTSETLLLRFAGLSYTAAWPSATWAPAWIVGLWFAFGGVLDTTRRALGDHVVVKSAVLGLVFGPLSYLAGARLGALTLPEPAWPSLLLIAAVWAMILPTLLKLQGLCDAEAHG